MVVLFVESESWPFQAHSCCKRSVCGDSVSAFGWRLKTWLSQQTRVSGTPQNINSPSLIHLYKVSLRNFFHILPDMLLLRIDVYLIELLLPKQSMEHDLGLYQAGVRVAELLLMLPGTLNAVLFAKAAAREDVADKALWSAKLCLYLGLLGCLGMLVIGKPLLVLFYGQRFAGSFVPCLLVLLGCTALSFSGPLAGTLSGASGYPTSVIVAQTTALLTNVGLNLWLLPRYGITGAALASTGAYTVSAICISIGFARHFRIPLRKLLAPVGPRASCGRGCRRASFAEAVAKETAVDYRDAVSARWNLCSTNDRTVGGAGYIAGWGQSPEQAAQRHSAGEERAARAAVSIRDRWQRLITHCVKASPPRPSSCSTSCGPV